MSSKFAFHKKIITGKQYFPHDITILPIMPSRWFHTQIIKTKKLAVSVILDGLIPYVVETKNNITTGNHGIRTLVWN